ncbi:MAG: histidine kinase N-terminal 7TM domain-containing protein [Roseiflexaceae bacterium]
MQALPYAIPYFLSAIAGLALMGYALQRSQSYYEARPFAMLMLGLTIWSATHAISMLQTEFAAIFFWVRMQYFGVVLVIPMWLLFALAFAGRGRISHLGLVLVCLPSLIVLILVQTSPLHQLWWTQVTLDTSRPFLAVAVERAPLFWVWAVFGYFCIVTGIWQFVRTAREAPVLHRRQAMLAVIGASFPLMGNIALLAGVRIEAIDDPTPFLFVGSCIVVWFATLRYRLLDLAPIAQRVIVESMPDGLLVINRAGVVAAVNQSAGELLEVAPEQWIGQRLTDMLGNSPLRDDILALLDEDSADATRTTIYHTGGQLRAIEVRLRPLQERSTTAAGALLVLRDRSDQVAAERALEQRVTEMILLNQVARAANAAAQTNDLLRAISGETVRLLDWDRIAVGLLQPDGSTLDIVIDTYLHDSSTLEGRSADASAFAQLPDILQLRKPRVLRQDDPALQDSATLRMLQDLRLPLVLAAPLYHQDQTLGLLFVARRELREVSSGDLRLFETIGTLISDAIVRTRLYEAAREASELKSVFLATVSHELRTPLTSILGFAEMLQRGVFGPLSAGGQESLDHIMRGGQTLLRLINDILDFSKMEAGYLSLDLYPVDTAAVIHKVIAALQQQIDERGLELRLGLADVPLVQANSTRLEQVLTNLIANAIKFTDKGSITIRTAQYGQQVRISVTDTGIGIETSHLDQIFQAFRQVENIYTRRYGGAGLGLAISQRLITLMGGRLSVESAPGSGSTFHCDLAISPLDIRPAELPNSARLTGRDITAETQRTQRI